MSPTLAPTQAPTRSQWMVMVDRAKQVQHSCTGQTGSLFGPLGATLGKAGMRLGPTRMGGQTTHFQLS